MKDKRTLKIFAEVLSIAALGTASVAPDILHIPTSMRPWVFLFTIAWILLIVSGIFET
ncbi:MAG: hypothetical protein HYU84_17485 [Chloroflexi bacterium]|nr:hypothetical protein [Chloroflexota bacterium]MBI3169995.1 hypothetical protein [Chloroflexota bacterium]